MEETIESIKKSVKGENKTKKKDEKIKIGKQSLRIHLSDGEIHFHNDKALLKVAVPIGDWWSAWTRLSCLNIESYSFLDVGKGTVLKVSVFKSDADELDVSVEIEKMFKKAPIKTSANFNKLDKYISRKG